MISDCVEGAYQAETRPGICVGSTKLIEILKGYMIPQSASNNFTLAVNWWLEQTGQNFFDNQLEQLIPSDHMAGQDHVEIGIILGVVLAFVFLSSLFLLIALIAKLSKKESEIERII